jgi:hypothetical protein
MTIEEIKEKVLSGKQVFYRHIGDEVIEKNGEWYIICWKNGYTIGLTSNSGELNGNPEDFITTI